MRLRLSGLLPVPGVLGLLVLVPASAAAQYSPASLSERYGAGWENDRLRVQAISIDPGTEVPASDANRVFVFMTADLEGRAPAAEAVWAPAGTVVSENRGTRPVEALMIELKDSPPVTYGGTAPEALESTGPADIRLLIDNPQVTVARHRYATNAYVDAPWHFHPQDLVVVYLRGGYAWPLYGGWGSYRVRRGDIDVVTANTLHAFSSVGSEPAEFLVVVTK